MSFAPNRKLSNRIPIGALALLLGVIALSAPLSAGDLIELRELASGLDNPVGVVNSGDGSERLFIVGQRGEISIWDGSGLLPQPFLDITDRVQFGGEQGLLGLAFHPDYADNGEFFVHYSARNGGDTQVSRFSVTANPDRADAGSEEEIFDTNQPFGNHNGGQIGFGPDGYLYIGLGDGGDGGDPGNRAQDLNEYLGKLLRIDVDGAAPYEVPSDNPFVGQPGARDEIWAYGLRNPWRFSFDRLTGDLFIGDVGQNQLEEIDFQSASSAGGENYGWRRMEGTECFNPSQNCNDGSLILPIIEYEHFGGGGFNCSVTGGHRYRGSAYADLSGLFIYGDYCSGKIWGAVQRPDGTWGTTVLTDTNLSITSFGEDERGELYVVDQGGEFFRVEGLEGRETRMSVVGNCPGASEISLRGLTPNGQVGFASSSNLGTTTLPGGSCAGSVLDLDAASAVGIRTADGNGEIEFTPNLPGSACDLLIQALDLTSCNTTNVEPLP